MSALTPCNYCTLQSIIRRHGAEAVTVKAAPVGDVRLWIGVFINDNPEPDALFMQLTQHCVC